MLLLLARSGVLAATAAAAPGLHVKHMSVETTLAADGSSVTTRHVELLADNAAAAMGVGQQALGYVTSFQTLDILEAYTLKPDGTKIPVDIGAIYDQLPPGAFGEFTDFHVKTIVFPQFSAGDAAVYTVRLTTKRAIFPGQYWGGDMFPKQVAYDDVQETLKAPADLALHVENHEVGYEKTQKGADIIYSWRFSAAASDTPEPPSIYPLSHIPRYFVSTIKDYAELGRAYAQSAAPQSAVTPKIKALADSITRNAHGEREIVRALYEWVVGHIRYVAVELGKGSLVPHAADDVLTNGYGDCKDHVALFAALLKAEGIASEAVLLNAAVDYALPDAPTFAVLNHVISYVPSLDIFLDSTSMVTPFGVLPFSEYGKPVVFASDINPRLGQIPALATGQASVTTKTDAHLASDGTLSGTTTTTATGPYSILLRIMGLGIQSIGSEAAAKRLMTARGYGQNTTGELQVPPPTALGDSYSVTGSFTAPHWTDQLAGARVFPIPGGMRLLGLSGDGLMGSFADADSKMEIEIPCYSGDAAEDLSLEAPPGKHFARVPDDVHVKTANIQFDAHWSLTNDILSVHRHFISSIAQPFCTADIRDANADALKTVADSYNEDISFEDATGSLGRHGSDGAAPTYPPMDPKFAQMLSDGFELVLRNDVDRAIAQFSKILEQRDVPLPAAYSAHLARAALYERKWQIDYAIADLDAGLALAPNDSRLLYERASVRFVLTDFAGARDDCDAELRQHPNNADALHLRANIAMETGQYQDAVRDYTTELQQSQFGTAYLLRAVAYHQLGRDGDAAGDVAAAGKVGDAEAKSDYDIITAALKSLPSRARMTNLVRDAAPTEGQPPPGVTDVVAIQNQMPSYPRLSARLGEWGRTLVDFTVEADGSVHDPVVEKSSGFPSLDAGAIEGVKTWRYHPAMRAGEPIALHHHEAYVVWMLE